MINRIIKRILLILFQGTRKVKYNLLSTIKTKHGNPLISQPLLILGDGQVDFGANVTFGVSNSPGYFNGVNYLESRCVKSFIKIGDNVWFNNNFTGISDGSGITIGKDCLVGFNVSIFDSDFHSLKPNERRSGPYQTKEVIIGENVFIGADVTILKGVTIGNNSVIGTGSVVTKSFPENVIIAGNPAKIIKSIA